MKRAHIIGICGVGMSATALLLKEAGYVVSGSDTASYGPTARILKNAGITPNVGYSASNIPEDADLFVIGRNAKLSPTENEEVRAALATGKPVRSFPEMIGELTHDRAVTVVAGSYGKSTTTALLAHILFETGAGYFVGAEPLSLPAPSRLGNGVFVVEGDEYPSAHDDPRAKFMHLHPRDVILTSVVHDHVNVYPTFADYQKPFRTLLALVPEDGLVVVCADETGARELAEESERRVVTYGLTEGAYQAKDIHFGERTTFTLTKNGAPVIELEIGLLGRHNVEDIVAASAYALERALISPDTLRERIASFEGVRRRLDRITPAGAIPAYEGFGSSYEKARAAIEAIRLHFPDKALVIVFEPHTFGWRNRANLPWYDSVFAGAAKVFVAPPESQGKSTHDQLSHEELLGRTGMTGIETLPYDPQHPEAVADSLSGNEVVLILTSGDFEGSLPSLVERIAARTF
ncbi:MAG TPA: Mur ligase family protein [Candidatus Paceibacterota bacterium]|nr:Mur ligase family protein [Candidatus Paceibacterota bacterium]